MVKALPKDISNKYEVIVVSPRNYFLYTPLLPAVATGTMEERSIVEAVRNITTGKADFYEAVCKDIDAEAKQLVCCFPADAGMDEACFKVPYDILVLSVGSINNTFGIKGVEQYCNFFKSIEDANAFRRRVTECFERAALPATPDDERKKLLSFVVVGGGPTGVEVAAELYDMIQEDMSKLYPKVVQDVKVSVVELTDHLLSTYDRAIAVYTTDQFKRAGISTLLNSRVASVQDGFLTVVAKDGTSMDIKFGACVWATGVAMNPLIKLLQSKIPGQKHFRSVLTDDLMRVKGSKGSIFAIGDAATLDMPKAMEHVEELFEVSDVNKDGNVSLKELKALLKSASTRFPHMAEHSRFLESKEGMNRFGNLARSIIASAQPAQAASPFADLDDSTQVSKEKFKELMGKIDNGLRALPATAQVAKQQGEFLASLLAEYPIVGDESKDMQGAKAFGYFHKGSAAYIGGDKAVLSLPMGGAITGQAGGFVWKGFETFSQISFRNQCLVATDWVRTKVFGRDMSRV